MTGVVFEISRSSEAVKELTIGWISAVRPSRQPPRGFLRMRPFLNAINNIPHAEERLKGASRSTHNIDAVPRSLASAILSHARRRLSARSLGGCSFALRHHKGHALELGDVALRIAVDGYDVRRLAGCSASGRDVGPPLAAAGYRVAEPLSARIRCEAM